ncbi:MAG: ParM/StbA family protein [Crocosphaera sp.]|nr:ParM/StbA family protein [Crocosphaera sp.]
MTDLVLAFDPSSSDSKGFYTTYPFKCEWLVMEPIVVRVEKTAIEQYEKNKISTGDETRNAWLEVDENYYAVGWLAQQHFHGLDKILTLKFETAIYKVLAMVGAIAKRKNLPTRFRLGLGVLLPYGEYPDRYRFKEKLAEALSSFRFRGRKYEVTLSGFNCLPEGGGLLMRGVEPSSLVKQKKVLILMIGYRNASILITDKGELARPFTTDLGFIRMLEMVERGSSGLSARELLVPICQAGEKVRTQSLKPLLKTTVPSLQKESLEQLRRTIINARQQYWNLLSDWLSNSYLPQVDKVVLAGGTSRYYQKSLEKWFSPQSITWGEELEKQVHSVIGEQGLEQGLAWRMTDVYGYFFYLQSVLKKTDKQAA